MAERKKIWINSDAHDVLKSIAAQSNRTMIQALDEIIHGTDVTTRHVLIRRVIMQHHAEGEIISRGAIQEIVYKFFSTQARMKDRFTDHREWLQSKDEPKGKFQNDVDNAIKYLLRKQRFSKSDTKGSYRYN